MLNINITEYRDKVTACWLGKCIGGTLGMPMEWRRQVNDVNFYTQELDGEPVPNDDLDLQLLWLIALEDYGVDVDAHILAGRWLDHLVPHWSEYGISKANLRAGLPPPLSGSFENKYKHSCGAFIRSEIWACKVPGRPELAAAFACEDAIIDHGDGEGSYAEIFIAAIESAAFVGDDVRLLLETGLSHIPEDCATAKAVKAVIRDFDAGHGWRQIREMIIRDFRGQIPFQTASYMSQEDISQGLADGEPGFDAPSNIAILSLGLLISIEKGFDEALCTTVNCGEDTDCIAATFGSIYGIMHGSKGIPERWIKPIGRKIKTCCINVSDFYIGGRVPHDVDELTERIAKLMEQCLILHPSKSVTVSAAPASQNPDWRLLTKDGDVTRKRLLHKMRRVTWRFPDDLLHVDFGGSSCVKPGILKTIHFEIEPRRWHPQRLFSVKVLAPDGWKARPSRRTVSCQPTLETLRGFLNVDLPVSERGGSSFSIEFTAPDGFNEPAAHFTVELSTPGRPETLYVPIMLQASDML